MSRIEKDHRPVIHVRMDARVLKQLDHLAVEMETDRARALEGLVRAALALPEFQWTNKEAK